MSQCVVPNWDCKHHRKNLDQSNECNKTSHNDLDNFHQHHNFQEIHSFPQIVPVSSNEVTELTWENGQIALHELGGIFQPSSTSSSSPKPTWAGGSGRANDTLESIVHQATHCNQQSTNVMLTGVHNIIKRDGSIVDSSEGKGCKRKPGPTSPPGLVRKRARSNSEKCCRNMINDHDSSGASVNAEFSRDNNETTLMTWTSFESHRSCTETKTTTDDDSDSQHGSDNQEDERETKEETGRSYTTRKGRAAAVHNQSERRRRERINQKMKALQKLVPNSSKTDKASMLDEVIEYLKHLQAQVQVINNARFMPQIMMPFGIQQHLQQMSLLARMGMGAGLGMGLGMGMLDTNNISQTTPLSIHQLLNPTQLASVTSAFMPPASATSAFAPPAFVAPQLISTTHQSNLDLGFGTSATLQDPYSTLLTQSINLDLYNRMAAMQRQQQTQAQATNNQMQFHNHVQGGYR